MTDRESTELRAELVAACAERDTCLARGDHTTALLLTAWIDVLLDEWNRRAEPR